jgi:hypothetical protein
MSLDFTTIKDQAGSAIFFMHDGTERSEASFRRLMEDVQKRTKKQCLLFSAKDENGTKIIRFYSLRGTNFVIIVRDDDQLHHVWSDGEQFDASKIAYTAEQAG